ncbi:sigma-70 family RNA polymerase sigma factor [Promicromonospora sp. MEB111]|uniref:sigma-70 family RNA polymerase sigma factor n=1 Tax=Promicromonospora sp. MEB111 TaxID=3040301 RepID=UPI0025500FE6|nr:sigma-70 family RNA polymerase sigma factor [Promicromonospora sp. MEB111]
MLDLPRPASARRSSPAAPVSDEVLLDDLRAGQDQAFADLYVRHRRTAYGVARQVVGSGPAVDDVVADAFTSLLSSVRAGRGPTTNVRSYLLTSVRNAAIGHLRARERTVPAEAQVVDRPHHDADALVAADDEHRVRRAFAALPPRWRRVLWYADVHDLAPAHVAPILGISSNAVSTLVRRARERLRREYLQAHQDRVAPGCEDYSPHLARYVEETLAAPLQHRVGVHVLACEHCTAAVEQMRDLRRRMRAVLLPFGLPAAAVAEPRGRHDRWRRRGSGSGALGAGMLGVGAATALGGWVVQALRRSWWPRPRGTEQAVLLPVLFLAMSLLTLAAVASSDVLDPAGRIEPPPVADAGTAGPDATSPPEPGAPTPSRPGGGRDGGTPPTGTPPAVWPGDGQAHDRWPFDQSSWVSDGGTAQPGANDPRPDPGPRPVPEPGPGPGQTPAPSAAPPPTNPTPTPTPEPEPLVLEVEYDDLGDLVPGRSGVLGATVRNPTADATGTVSVDVTLPAGVELDVAGGSRAVSGWTCAAGTPDGPACTVDGVAAGGTSTLLVPVLVGADTAVGAADLRLDLHGDGVAPAGVDATVPVSQSPFTARYVATGPVEVAVVGAPVLHCDPAEAGCAAVVDGSATGAAQNNNAWNMVTVDALGTGTASSTAELALPAGSEVVAARLYWSGRCAGDVAPVRVGAPGAVAEAVAGPLSMYRSGQRYQASADVTGLVRSGGAGTWGVADVCATEGVGANAGWALVVLHRPAGTGAAGRGLAIVYDGLMAVSPSADPPRFAVAGRPGTAARIGAVAWDGDRSGATDRLELDGTPLVPMLWGGAGEVGTGSAGNAFDSTAWGSAYANALGVDVKPFQPVAMAAPRAELVAVGEADAYTLGVVTVATGS